MDTTQHTFNIASNIPWLLILKILSVAINIFVLIRWIRGKIILNKFLLGRWEGNMVNSTTQAKLDCILIVTECAERANKAFFYYEQTYKQEITVRGGDELHDYDSDTLFIRNKKWKPVFFRQFHIAYNDVVGATQADFTGTVNYQWNCDIQNIWTKPKIKIAISGNSIELKGVLHKS